MVKHTFAARFLTCPTILWILDVIKLILYVQQLTAGQTSLTSRKTRQESKNPSIIKTYSVGFNHGAKTIHNKRS